MTSPVPSSESQVVAVRLGYNTGQGQKFPALFLSQPREVGTIRLDGPQRAYARTQFVVGNF